MRPEILGGRSWTFATCDSSRSTGGLRYVVGSLAFCFGIRRIGRCSFCPANGADQRRTKVSTPVAELCTCSESRVSLGIVWASSCIFVRWTYPGILSGVARRARKFPRMAQGLDENFPTMRWGAVFGFSFPWGFEISSSTAKTRDAPVATGGT